MPTSTGLWEAAVREGAEGVKIMAARSLCDLTGEDLSACPIWELVEGPNSGDPLVKPVKSLPVQTMRLRLAGVQVILADGTRNWALLGNVSANNARSTKHFVTLSIERNGVWFTLARYHDVDFEQRGGGALAAFLGKPLESIFPIKYDLSKFAKGDPEALSGAIENNPRERLSLEELMQLSLEEG